MARPSGAWPRSSRRAARPLTGHLTTGQVLFGIPLGRSSTAGPNSPPYRHHRVPLPPPPRRLSFAARVRPRSGCGCVGRWCTGQSGSGSGMRRAACGVLNVAACCGVCGVPHAAHHTHHMSHTRHNPHAKRHTPHHIPARGVTPSRRDPRVGAARGPYRPLAYLRAPCDLGA